MRPSALAAALTLCALPARAVTVAVSYFDNDSGQADYAPLSKGLADMLISDLANVSSLTIVEREKLNAILDELELSSSKFIDPRTAQRLGKGLAAQYILTGSYFLQGTTFRIDARVLKVDTGAVAASEKVEGKPDEFFAMEKELVDLLVKTLDLKLGFSEKGKLRSNQTESFSAWKMYSAGLDASDRGQVEEAQRLFLSALNADPNYKAAKTASERLAALYAKVDADQSRGWSAQFKALDPRSRDFARQVEALLRDADSTKEEGMKQKLAVLTWLAERDLYPQSIPQLNLVALEAMALAGRFLDCPAEWDSVLATCDYFAARVPRDSTVLGTCRSTLSVISSYRKDPQQAGHLAASWAEHAERDAKLDSDNWMGVLARNHAGIVGLMHLYASKARR